jgi:uncharacterized cupin superfamily protein
MNYPGIIQLPKILDKRGNLTFIEGLNHIPFKFRRTFWIYDVPGGETRGGHAYKSSEEFIIALSGSFDIILDSGKEKKTWSLNRSYYGLYVPAGIWRHMENFSTNSLALVLSSSFYKADDYLRDYEDYKKFATQPLTDDTAKILVEPDILPHCVSKNNSVNDCKRIDLDINHRDKGNITVIEDRKILPVDIKRVYYLYDVPGGESRGGHAHKNLHQLIVAASGSFDVVLNDGEKQTTIHLDRSYSGLYVVPGIWRELVNFSSGSICLVLASELYDASDYIRDFNDFENFKQR